MIQQLPKPLASRPASLRVFPALLGPHTADTLHIDLLGFPQVTRAGVPIIFARRAAMALLAYLAVSGRPHSRETLATLISGEVAEQRARTLLRNALADLTSQIGNSIVVTRQSVRLNLERPRILDVAVLEEALRVAHATGNIAQLQLAVDRYQHELLEGFALRDAPSFDEWLLLERERVNNLLIQALDLLCTVSIERGEYVSGLVYAQRLLALEPWRDETRRQATIMMAHSSQHRRADRCGLAAQAAQPDGFVGRRCEIKQLATWLEDPACRLICVVGTGGCGKTRLALQAAAHYTPSDLPAAARFPDGVFYVALERVAAATDREAEAARCLLRATARTLDITLDEQINLADQVCDALKNQVALLVVDNIEHLRSGAAVLERLLRAAPGVKILVTSRVQLALKGARTLTLGPMGLPESADDLERADASVLFLQQARQARTLFEPNDTQRAAIVRICRLVEGLPLGVMLAARLTATGECSEIAARLATGTDVLATNAPSLPDRHRSLAASFGYSWALLNADEQRALRQLSVFEGPFSVDAAMAVAAAPAARLRSLHDASILATTSDGRPYVPGLLRPQIAHMCSQSGEQQEARLRHASYYTEMIAQSLPLLTRERNKPCAIARELPNIQAAWAWVLDSVRGEATSGDSPALATEPDL
ncbi:MAG: AAA family ATPase [Roseiflexaceae bacterium]|nr:AAA family ATPase [Roseiflexaceae bacterium]